jgi:HEAT repeat protein
LNESADPHVVPFAGPCETFDPARAAAWALGQIAPGSAKGNEVIAALMEVASSGPLNRRGGAANGLAEFGPAAEESVPVLIKLINDATPEDTFERGAASAWALGKIAPETPSADRAFAALIPALKSKNHFSRLTAIQALGRFGSRAAAAIPEIRPLKGDGNVEIKVAAAKTLLAIENASAP